MFDVDRLIEELFMEMSMLSSGIDQFTIDTLMKNYVLPAFNRDYPYVMTMIIRDKARFYPYVDLTGSLADRFLNHIFLIKQDRAMYTQLQTQMGVGEADNFVTVVSTDVVNKILRFSYKNQSFVFSPVILYDDISNSYYYSLDPANPYVLIYTIMNDIDSTRPITPMDYEVLKAYGAYKISEFVITGMDMSTIGVLNEYLAKIMEGVKNSDSTKLFNPAVSSLSFGGEISIGFSPQGTLTQAVQSALPIIRTGFSDVQNSLRKFNRTNYIRFQNLMKKRFLWLQMV